MAENNRLISCSYPTENALYTAYMPFVRNGGLFVRTNENLPLGTKVNLTVLLLNDPETHTIETKVVWITPSGAQGNKPAGLGLQFVGDNKQQLTNKIETHLAGMLKSTQLNDTM